MRLDEIDRETLEQVLADHAGALLHGCDDPLESLYRLTDNCVAVLGLAGAGICLGDETQQLYFVAATDGRASRVENHQLAEGEGPGYLAYRTGQVIAVEDIDTDDRWPGYQQMCLHMGYRSIAGIPMPVTGDNSDPIGTLNMYDTEPRLWTPEQTMIATLLSGLATGYVLMCRRATTSADVSEQLRHALEARDVVAQAQGRLAVDRHIDANEAFVLLRDHARSNRRPIRDVATDVIEGTSPLE